MNKYSFKVYNKSFVKNIPSSFKNISSPFRYNYDESNRAIMLEDKFYFYNENNYTFSNLLNFMKLELGEKNYAFIGLQLSDNLEKELLTFPRALKQYQIINNYIFFIYYNKYENNDEISKFNGNIYLGEYPHNIKEFSMNLKKIIFMKLKHLIEVILFIGIYYLIIFILGQMMIMKKKFIDKLNYSEI